MIASKLIYSKYSIIISDDEIYLPSALKRLAKELNDNHELLSVGASALAVWKYGNRICGNWAYKKSHLYENMENDALSRLKKHTGDGNDPITAFFTSNLTRTEALVECLKLYAKSPTIATESISLLSICARGGTKYLPFIYWIRNWNEPPKSHPEWKREIYIHDWWRNNEGSNERARFAHELETFVRLSLPGSQFNILWDLILESSESSAPKHAQSYNSTRFNSYTMRNAIMIIKYYYKMLFGRKDLPDDYRKVLESMALEGVDFDSNEIYEAVSIVSSIYPYKAWARKY
jgi:hypothetical protein